METYLPTSHPYVNLRTGKPAIMPELTMSEAVCEGSWGFNQIIWCKHAFGAGKLVSLLPA
jgi:hypothetical protein